MWLLDGLCVHAYRTGCEREEKKTPDGWSPFKIVCPADGAVTGAAVYFAFWGPFRAACTCNTQEEHQTTVRGKEIGTIYICTRATPLWSSKCLCCVDYFYIDPLLFLFFYICCLSSPVPLLWKIKPPFGNVYRSFIFRYVWSLKSASAINAMAWSITPDWPLRVDHSTFISNSNESAKKTKQKLLHAQKNESTPI